MWKHKHKERNVMKQRTQCGFPPSLCHVQFEVAVCVHSHPPPPPPPLPTTLITTHTQEPNTHNFSQHTTPRDRLTGKQRAGLFFNKTMLILSGQTSDCSIASLQFYKKVLSWSKHTTCMIWLRLCRNYTRHHGAENLLL